MESKHLIDKVLGKVFLDQVHSKARERLMNDVTGTSFDEHVFRVTVEEVVEALRPNTFKDAQFICLDVGPRYWEDSTVNGIEDTYGHLMPLRDGDNVVITINIETGQVLDWPQGTTANIHYKVCDQGEYFLLNDIQETIAKYKGSYPPDGDDYIVMDINENGFIEEYSPIKIDEERWKLI